MKNIRIGQKNFVKESLIGEKILNQGQIDRNLIRKLSQKLSQKLSVRKKFWKKKFFGSGEKIFFGLIIFLIKNMIIF